MVMFVFRVFFKNREIVVHLFSKYLTVNDSVDDVNLSLAVTYIWHFIFCLLLLVRLESL